MSKQRITGTFLLRIRVSFTQAAKMLGIGRNSIYRIKAETA